MGTMTELDEQGRPEPPVAGDEAGWRSAKRKSASASTYPTIKVRIFIAF